MSHLFLPSIKEGVSFCLECGCLSYKNIISKHIIQNNNKNIMKIDPLEIRYNPISLKTDLSLLSHKTYIENRKKGLSKIYFLSNKFNLEKNNIYKAIGLTDQLYLNNNNISIENIEIIASICLLLSYEFNNCCNISNINKNESEKTVNNFVVNNNFENNNNIKGLYQYIKNEINNLMYWETFCLKNLNYHLGKYSAFDYINLFFGLGIVFTKEPFDIVKKYEICLNIFDLIINQSFICKYNQYILGLSIIFILFNNNPFFDKSIFKYIYGVDFTKRKYKSCVNEINIMISNIYNINNNVFWLINNYINNCTNPLIFDIFEYFINNNNSNNSIISKDNEFLNSYIKELLINYIVLFEKCSLNNSMHSSNNYFSSNLNFQTQQIKELIDNILRIHKCNYKSKNDFLYDENKERQNLVEKEEKFN